MMLNDVQTRTLHSVENLMLGYDILNTKKLADREAKKSGIQNGNLVSVHL